MRSNYGMIHITVAVMTDRMHTVLPVLALQRERASVLAAVGRPRAQKSGRVPAA